MGNELQTQAQPPALRIADTVANLKTSVQMVQAVMREVMKPDVHYGKVPGTDKPTLLQPGAETICLAFHWATRYLTEDLSSLGVVRYRVTCDLHNRDTGEFVGSGQGEASSEEEKYMWRKIVCDAEFDETQEDRRRVVWKRGKGGSTYQVKQVRIQAADIANTVLKMANKRSHVAATKTASGCSDMFAQDLEDMSAETRAAVTGESEQQEAPKPIGQRSWQKLVGQAKPFGYAEADILASAATLGFEGPGASMPEDIAKRLYAAMKANPVTLPKEEPAITVDPETGEIIPDECAEPVKPAAGGFRTPLGDD